MKVMSKVSLTVGILAVLAAAGILAWGSLDVWGNMQAKYGHESMNPYPALWIGFGVGILGGFFTGLGLVSPRKAPASPIVPSEPQIG
jgi:hypothetical protein